MDISLIPPDEWEIFQLIVTFHLFPSGSDQIASRSAAFGLLLDFKTLILLITLPFHINYALMIFIAQTKSNP
jgi:hypothetical protein